MRNCGFRASETLSDPFNDCEPHPQTSGLVPRQAVLLAKMMHHGGIFEASQPFSITMAAGSSVGDAYLFLL